MNDATPEVDELEGFLDDVDVRFERDYPNYAAQLKGLFDKPLDKADNFIWEEVVAGYALCARNITLERQP